MIELVGQARVENGSRKQLHRLVVFGECMVKCLKVNEHKVNELQVTDGMGNL